jgi:hypothetical protein
MSSTGLMVLEKSSPSPRPSPHGEGEGEEPRCSTCEGAFETSSVVAIQRAAAGPLHPPQPRSGLAAIWRHIHGRSALFGSISLRISRPRSTATNPRRPYLRRPSSSISKRVDIGSGGRCFHNQIYFYFSAKVRTRKGGCLGQSLGTFFAPILDLYLQGFCDVEGGWERRKKGLTADGRGFKGRNVRAGSAWQQNGNGRGENSN